MAAAAAAAGRGASPAAAGAAAAVAAAAAAGRRGREEEDKGENRGHDRYARGERGAEKRKARGGVRQQGAPRAPAGRARRTSGVGSQRRRGAHPIGREPDGKAAATSTTPPPLLLGGERVDWFLGSGLHAGFSKTRMKSVRHFIVCGCHVCQLRSPPSLQGAKPIARGLGGDPRPSLGPVPASALDSHMLATAGDSLYPARGYAFDHV